MPKRVQSERPIGQHFFREWRKKNNMNQRKLADKIGMSIPNLSRIERMEQGYTQQQLESIAEEFGISTVALLTVNPLDKNYFDPNSYASLPPEVQATIRMLHQKAIM